MSNTARIIRWQSDPTYRGNAPEETSSLLGSDSSAHTAYDSPRDSHPCRAASKGGCCCGQPEATPPWWNPFVLGRQAKQGLSRIPAHISRTIEKPRLAFCSFTFAVLFLGWVSRSYLGTEVMDLSVCDGMRNGWQKDYERHQILSVKFANEIEAHNVARVAMQAERTEWAIERKQWEEEHGAREKVRLGERQLDLETKRRQAEKEIEDEKKAKAGVRFANPQPEPQCLRYGTRKWTAKLDNVPTGFDPILVCRETKAHVNGRWLLPDTCENKGTWSGTIGTWYIDFEEAACHPYWTRVQDKGCTAEGSGQRRIEAKLENVRSGDDWEALCASTPAEFHGLKFDGPHSCADWGRMGYGGIWFIEDGAC